MRRASRPTPSSASARGGLRRPPSSIRTDPMAMGGLDGPSRRDRRNKLGFACPDAMSAQLRMGASLLQFVPPRHPFYWWPAARSGTITTGTANASAALSSIWDAEPHAVRERFVAAESRTQARRTITIRCADEAAYPVRVASLEASRMRTASRDRKRIVASVARVLPAGADRERNREA